MMSRWLKSWGLVVLAWIVFLPGLAESAAEKTFSYADYGAAL